MSPLFYQKPDTSNLNQIKDINDTLFKSLINVSTFYEIALPFNIKTIETKNHDSTIFLYPDSSLIVKNWILNSYFEDYNYPLTEYGDVDVDKIVLTDILNIFSVRCENLIRNNDPILDLDKIEFIIRNSKEYIINGTKRNYQVCNKIMLCNVSGGTHAIVILNVRYRSNKMKIAQRIIDETIPK